MLLPPQVRTLSFLPYVLAIGILLLIGAAGSFYVYKNVDASLQKHILDRANTIALMVQYDKLKTLSGSEADVNDPTYRSMKATLMLVRLANPDARFIYLVGKAGDGNLFFYMDSEKSDSEDYSPPGQVYEEAPEKMYQVLATGKSQSDRYSDRWGNWVSGYAPVYDQYGKVIAMLGMDVPADEYLRNALFYASIPLLVCVLFALLIGLILTIRERELKYISHKAEFLSIASHEIRSPLTGIRWALGSILKTEPSPIDTEVRAMLLKAHTNTINLIYRISNFLSVSALETGAQKIHLEPVVVGKVVKEVFEDLSLAAEERHVRFALDATLGDTVMVNANPEYMRQILFNIIANAVKYTKTDTVVMVLYAKTAQSHEILVRDQGEGIAKADQERIFGGYQRTHEAQAGTQEGTGLGLYLTKEALRMQGGSIRVESEEHKGTTFVIVLSA